MEFPQKVPRFCLCGTFCGNSTGNSTVMILWIFHGHFTVLFLWNFLWKFHGKFHGFDSVEFPWKFHGKFHGFVSVEIPPFFVGLLGKCPIFHFYQIDCNKFKVSLPAEWRVEKFRNLPFFLASISVCWKHILAL